MFTKSKDHVDGLSLLGGAGFRPSIIGHVCLVEFRGNAKDAMMIVIIKIVIIIVAIIIVCLGNFQCQGCYDDSSPELIFVIIIIILVIIRYHHDLQCIIIIIIIMICYPSYLSYIYIHFKSRVRLDLQCNKCYDDS